MRGPQGFFPAPSVFAYILHYAIFRDARHILIDLIGDLAFLPVQILFVTLIVDRLLNKREKMALLKKMNMVIGVFFSEMGRSLLKSFNWSTSPSPTCSGQSSTSWRSWLSA
jgi:hypothetical protein